MINIVAYENAIIAWKMGTITIGEFRKRFNDLCNSEKNQFVKDCTFELYDTISDYVTGIESHEFYVSLDDIRFECDQVLDRFKDEHEMRYYSWVLRATNIWSDDIPGSELRKIFNKIPTEREFEIFVLLLKDAKYTYSARELQTMNISKLEIENLLEKYDAEK